MFRTRDFVLFFTTIIFLVSAIGITILSQVGTEARQNTLLPKETKEITNVDAVVLSSNEEVDTKESRIERLKRKIEESGVVSYSEPEEDMFVSTGQTEDNTVLPSEQTVQLCANYSESTFFNWNPTDITVQEVEGVRQYFTTKSVEVASTTASTTDLVVEKTVKLVLPVATMPIGGSTCLSSNIIGVAVDGSLMRNSEVGLYGIFSSETLLGYALDGFPIYGVGQSLTDECGGRTVGGQYRYELSVDRETLISCYSGTPQTIK